MIATPRRAENVRHARWDAGFTFIELLVALTLLATVAIFILQTFVSSMTHTGRSNERAAATTIGMQVMEQIRASVNPYTMVGFVSLARTALPLPAPYSGVTNPTPHPFEVAVNVALNPDLTLTTASVQIFRPADVTPFIELITVLDDQ
ncbi:MAG: prepilin-type N-terminal cleavage/methylation domain-containing protein [Armatimonadota bacterium]